MVEYVVRIFSLHGMTVNLDKHKSAVLFSIHGAGLHAALVQASQDLEGRLKFSMQDGTVAHIHVERQYKHLGSLHCDSPTQFPELRYRAATAGSVFATLRRSVFKVPGLTIERKATFAQSVMMSRQGYNCGTWHELSVPEFAFFTKIVMRMHREVAGFSCIPKSGDPSDIDVLHLVSACPPVALIKHKRISLFMRLVRKQSYHAVACVVAASGARGSWFDSLVKDLQWIALRSSTLGSLRGAGMGEWISFLCSGAAPRSLAKAFSEPLLREREAWDIRPEPVVDRGFQDGIHFDSLHHCTVCQYTARTYQQLAVHLARKHGIKVQIRKFIDAHWCPVCLLYFGARPRVVDHVQKSPVCRFNIQCSYPMLPDTVVAELDEADRVQIALGKQLSKGKRGAGPTACRMLGPYLPIFGRTDGPSASSAHPIGPNRGLLLRPPEFAS